MRSRISVLAFLLLTACASGYQQFYKPYVDVKTLLDVQTLGQGETPKILVSNDLQRDVKGARSKGYQPIGASSFNGEIESEKAVVQQAQRVGAVLVLVNSKFTETRAITTPLFLPNNQTTYSSGSVYGTYGSAEILGNQHYLRKHCRPYHNAAAAIRPRGCVLRQVDTQAQVRSVPYRPTARAESQAGTQHRRTNRYRGRRFPGVCSQCSTW